MPFLFDHDPDKQFSHVRLVGEMGFEELSSRRAAYIAIGVAKYELIEMQQVDLMGISADKFVEHATQVRKFQPPPEPGSKTAVVYSQKYQVGLMRMVENIVKSFGEDWPREFKFFKSVAEARAWLEID